MGAKPVLNTAQRQTRLGRRHHLASAARAASAVEVADGIVGLHATDPATVYLSLFARSQHPSVAQVESALYEDKTLLRMLGMRRTMFVVPTEFAPVVQAACTRTIASRERRRSIQLFGPAGLADDTPTWLAAVEEQTFEALAKRGKATAHQLAEDIPALKRQVQVSPGKSYAGVISVCSRVLFQLSADGRIVRGRPRGTWISGQYHWSPATTWLRGGLPEISPPTAQAALIASWLRRFGPGTLADLRWWTGLTLGEVQRALQAVQAVEVHLDEASGWIMEDDLHAEAPCEPWVGLLPALDPTPMGYVDRAWFLGGHGTSIFDHTGNIGPSVWCDGRIVGGWAHRKDGTIAYKLLEDVGAEAERVLESAAHDLGMLLGPVRVTPRFRTPLERELSA
ncbi:MAG: winged helix DNA-binding domain-containing protein [Chloroflexota bacterium]